MYGHGHRHRCRDGQHADRDGQLGSNGAGSFGTDECTLSGSGASASCSVSYTPAASDTLRTDTITASYGGDSTHAGSSATAAVAVQPTSDADCRHGGWQNYGFQNQRQCIQFVNGFPVPPISKADCLHGGWRTTACQPGRLRHSWPRAARTTGQKHTHAEEP